MGRGKTAGMAISLGSKTGGLPYINSQTQPNEGARAAQMDRAQGVDGELTW
jgi:hypothetical protein